MRNLPVFYYRSTIITIDDEPMVADALSLLLQDNFDIKSFNKPHEFLDFMQTYQVPLSDNIALRGCKEHEYYDTASHTIVDFNIPELHTLRKQPERNNEISVIIVDYRMPEINGVELCTLIKHINAKKILLTGDTNLQTAVSAFNDNIIDRFIKKSSPSMPAEILATVTELAHIYYQEKTSSILTHLEASRPSPLSDPDFVLFFTAWRKDQSIKEYTLIDKNGSFCMQNNNGEFSYFIVHTDNSLDSFIQINEDEAEAAPFLDSIKKRELIPFFGIGKDCWSINPNDWEKHFHKANKLTGRENYYWSVIS